MPLKLQTWLAYGDIRDKDVGALVASFSPKEEVLYEWLTRLERTQDFRKCQKELARVVGEILLFAKENPSFKDYFLNQAEANNTACDDRSAMALNELYVQFEIARGKKTPEEAFTLLQRAPKTMALRALLEKKDCRL